MCEKLGLKLLQHPHLYHVQWLSDCGEMKITHMVKVQFKIGDYSDTIECDVVPMKVRHLLLGRPWQYDLAAQHCGWTNQYTIKWKGKDLVLRPMTPQQIMAEHLQKISEVKIGSEKEGEKNNSRDIHKSVSECHKLNLSDKKKREGENLVMLATKSELRGVRQNPNQVIIVLMYKDALFSANDLTCLPSAISHVLQNYKDVFPK